LAKTQYFGKITAFYENCGFRDFRVSVIIYCPYLCDKRDVELHSLTHSLHQPSFLQKLASPGM